jgi:sirohydrochlorin ferrochelatase
MVIALIDNGSLEPAAQRNLRAVAAALSARVGVSVEAVSWKHSDRVPAALLDGRPAWALAPFIRAHVARGQREFLFVPFFISAQGAIGSALRADLEKLSGQLGGFAFSFTEGLAGRGVLADIVAARIRETIASTNLARPAVLIVDHGGPSPASAALRDAIAADVRRLLAPEVGPLAAASMEGLHGPLFTDALRAPDFNRGDVVVAPLFLSPGRHAGSDGDLARLAREAQARAVGLRCHFTALVGTHPLAVAALATALHEFLDSVSDDSPQQSAGSVQPIPLPA